MRLLTSLLIWPTSSLSSYLTSIIIVHRLFSVRSSLKGVQRYDNLVAIWCYSCLSSYALCDTVNPCCYSDNAGAVTVLMPRLQCQPLEGEITRCLTSVRQWSYFLDSCVCCFAQAFILRKSSQPLNGHSRGVDAISCVYDEWPRMQYTRLRCSSTSVPRRKAREHTATAREL